MGLPPSVYTTERAAVCRSPTAPASVLGATGGYPALAIAIISSPARPLLPRCDAARRRLSVTRLLLAAPVAYLEVATGPADLWVVSILPTVPSDQAENPAHDSLPQPVRGGPPSDSPCFAGLSLVVPVCQPLLPVKVR